MVYIYTMTKTAGTGRKERRLVLLLYRAHHALFRSIDREAKAKLGITGAQIGPLLYVARNPGCVQGDVGLELGINKAATSKLIRRMEEAGLVLRESDADDARVMSLHLSEKGREIVTAMGPVIRRLNKKLVNDFSDAEIDVIARFLSTTAATFKE